MLFKTGGTLLIETKSILQEKRSFFTNGGMLIPSIFIFLIFGRMPNKWKVSPKSSLRISLNAIFLFQITFTVKLRLLKLQLLLWHPSDMVAIELLKNNVFHTRKRDPMRFSFFSHFAFFKFWHKIPNYFTFILFSLYRSSLGRENW